VTDLPDSSLQLVLPLDRSNLLFLVGGPPSPLYPPNKVILWDSRLSLAVAELEFSEDVRGLAARRDRLVVVLRRRVVVFVLGKGEVGLWREGAYQTCDNLKGPFPLFLSFQSLNFRSLSFHRPRRTRHRPRLNPPRLPRPPTRSSATCPPPTLRPFNSSSASSAFPRPDYPSVPLRLDYPRP
jgi:hypothetical protein